MPLRSPLAAAVLLVSLALPAAPALAEGPDAPPLGAADPARAGLVEV